MSLWPRKKKQRISRKRPMAWHEEALKNWTGSFERRRIALEKEIELLEIDEQRLAEYEAQIEKAKKRGLTEFDRDKFGKPRKKKAE